MILFGHVYVGQINFWLEKIFCSSKKVFNFPVLDSLQNQLVHTRIKKTGKKFGENHLILLKFEVQLISREDVISFIAENWNKSVHAVISLYPYSRFRNFLPLSNFLWEKLNLIKTHYCWRKLSEWGKYSQ